MADISSITLPGGGTYDLKDKNAVHTSAKGAANGVAELDSTGKVPSSQLPSIVPTVIANPSGEATDSLDKLQVESTIYQIPVGGKPINYSTDEKYTGQKWVDGKKIYQKTFAVKRTDLQDSTLTVDNVAGFIYLTENYPMIWIDESASVLFIPATEGVNSQPVNYDGGNTLTRLNITRASGRNNGKQYIYFQTTYWTSIFYNSDIWTLYITIKYTKTTDTPTPPGGLYVDADEVTFDNTASGLSATDVQGAVDELAEDKANQSQLAYVETGTTASRNYAVGEYFCWNGLLYRAKTAISNGASFTPGTNCEQVTGGGLNEVKGIDISSYISVNLNRLNNVSIRAKYYPGSRKVELQANGSAASSLSAAQNTLFLVASPYSVGIAVQFIGCGLKNTSNIVPVYISTGSVNMQHGGLSAGDNVAISISWYV